MKNFKLKTILIECGLFLLQVVFSKIPVLNFSFSLGFSFALVRIFHGVSLAIVVLEFFIAGILRDFSFLCFVILAYQVVVLSLYYFSLEYIKVKKKIILQIIFILISKALKLYFCLFILEQLLWLVLECVIDIVAIVYFKALYKIYQKKFIFKRFNKFEYLLLATMLMFVFLGLFGIEILGVYFVIPISVFVLIFLCRVMPSDKYLFTAIIVLFCAGMVLNDLLIVLYAIFLVIFCVSFVFLNKYCYFLIVELVLIAELYLSGNLFLVSNCIALLPAIICCCLPNKIYLTISGFFSERELDFIGYSVEKDKICEIKYKLESMSKTFFSMKENFKMLIVGKINRKSAATELAIDVMKRICENCPNLKLCVASCLDRRKLIADNIVYAIEKGKLYLDELGGGIKTYCLKPNVLVNEINSITGQYLSFEKSIKNEDESKLLISSELENFAKIFKNFAKNTEIMSKNNKNLSFLIKETLLGKMIDVYDVAVFESDCGIDFVQVVVDNEQVVKSELVQAINSIVKSKMTIEKIKHLEYSGVSLITLKPALGANCQFVCSTSAKENVNGDNLSIARLDNGRFFVAIADGMGHGKNAGRISKMVLELVRSMFVAGLDIDLVVESINKLLLPVGLDNFSTLDACVIDLNLMNCSFIKLGSSVSILKHKMTSEIIECKSLPIGIVQNIRPTIINKKIFEGDTIFLASDGVVDAFGDTERYRCFINDAKFSNLQKFTDDIIEEIKVANVSHGDDMSIIAVKLLKNNQK